MKEKIEDRLGLGSIETSSIEFTSTTCTVAADFDDDCLDDTGDAITVVVSTTHKMGLVGALLSWAGTGSTVTISATATMRTE